MSHFVDSRTIPHHQRADYIHTLARAVVPVALGFPRGQESVRGSVTELGPLLVTAITSNAHTVERTPGLARDDLQPSLMLGLQTSGSSLLVQDGREILVRPGDLCVYRSTTPYTLADADGYRQYQVRMPLDRFALPSDVVRRITAVRLSPEHPITDLALAYFRRLTTQPQLFDGAGSHLVGQPSIELIRAVIGTHLDLTSSLTAQSLNATLQLRILEYIRAHLSDPDLNAQQIAAEHHISVRHLYNVLAAGGIVLGDWIRAQRLEGCRQQLAQLSSRNVPILLIARRWGFRDASNFGRLFRGKYGLSPRQWREQSLRGQRPGSPVNT